MKLLTVGIAPRWRWTSTMITPRASFGWDIGARSLLFWRRNTHSNRKRKATKHK